MKNTGGISGTSITNLIGNGFNVYYDATLSANNAFGGKTYNLVNGGVLAPKGSTVIDQQENKQPPGYILHQNYPNPFNPTTTITFELPKESFVQIEMFNVIGERVATLVQERRTTGYYSVVFNASFFSSGIYFFKMTAGNFIAIKKSVLMK